MNRTTVFERNPSLRQPPGRPGWAASFAPVLDDLRATLRARDPATVAALSGAAWDAGAPGFELELIGERCRLAWPDLVALHPGAPEPLAADLQGLLLYYLALADGSDPAGRWVSFRELPDGWLYHQAFQGYTGDLLARSLANAVDAFDGAAGALNGERLDAGDRGYVIPCLPRVRLAVVYWLGDDEFEPRAQLLFDARAGRYLTTDGLAVLGSLLVRRLLKGVQAAGPGQTHESGETRQ